jgi:O-antigen ligase
LASLNIYFKSPPEETRFTITEIKALNKKKGEFSFSLLKKDLIASGNLKLDQLSSDAVSITKIASIHPSSPTLYFDMRTSIDEVFVRTDTRMLEKPSLLAMFFILILGILMAFSLYPLHSSLQFKGTSTGTYLLAAALIILPTGEHVCNLLLILAIVAGMFEVLRKSTFLTWINANRRIIFITLTIIAIYSIALILSLTDGSSLNLLKIKFGVPVALLAVAANTSNKQDLRLQYAALLTGVIVSVFIHFGWIVMFVDTVEIKSKLLSYPHYYLETSIFTQVHHSYLSVIYLVSLSVILFKKEMIPLRKKEIIIYTTLIVIALLFAFSRAAILCVALSLLFYAFRSALQLFKLEIITFVRFFTASVLTISLLAIIFINFDLSASTDGSAINGLQTRLRLWENASELIKQKPVTGWGPESFKTAFKEMNSLIGYNNNSRFTLNTHNQFLETSGMFGLVAGTGLIWFLLFPTGFSRQSSRISSIILYTAIIFITGFLFESFLTRNLGILIFGLVYGLLIKHFPESSENLHHQTT